MSSDKIMQPLVSLWHYGTVYVYLFIYMYTCRHLWLKFTKCAMWDTFNGLSTALSDKCDLVC